jgi:hypothetical protein
VRTFTPEEANDALPEIAPLVQRMVDAGKALDEAREQQETLERKIGGNGGGIPPERLAAAAADVERLAEDTATAVRALQERGVLVKDLDVGLIDFPSIRDGEEVELCWRLGEARVEYWHRPGEGFAGRKPI